MKGPRIGIFKFTSCDGCQLSILNLEDEILHLIDLFDVAYFREASDNALRGHFDIAVVEGSVSTEWQRKALIDIRERSLQLITIGACATAGGLQALRNWANFTDYRRYVYPEADAVKALSTSTPVSENVHVNFELWGCPINNIEFSEVLTSLLIGRKPGIPAYSLCMECKRKGVPCILVAHAEPCLGPVTRAGCGVLCPSLDRPCYGCFGPKEGANIASLLGIFQSWGLSLSESRMLLDKMNTYAYRKETLKKT